jgi:hypothetical protein
VAQQLAKGFVLLPRCWVVERTLAWLNRNRRLAQDAEATTSVKADVAASCSPCEAPELAQPPVFQCWRWGPDSNRTLAALVVDAIKRVQAVRQGTDPLGSPFLGK